MRSLLPYIIAGLIISISISTNKQTVFETSLTTEAIQLQNNLATARTLLETICSFDILETTHYESVNVTCYTSDEKETDGTPFIDAVNSTVHPGLMAVSRDLDFLVGKEVILKGYGLYVVNDVMDSRWEHRVDIWSGNWKQAIKHGVQRSTLIWQ